MRERRSQPHSIRSANTTSREPGVRFHSALPRLAARTESSIPSGSETASMWTSPGGTIAHTASAGTTTTNAVATTASGSQRSTLGAPRIAKRLLIAYANRCATRNA